VDPTVDEKGFSGRSCHESADDLLGQGLAVFLAQDSVTPQVTVFS